MRASICIASLKGKDGGLQNYLAGYNTYSSKEK